MYVSTLNATTKDTDCAKPSVGQICLARLVYSSRCCSASLLVSSSLFSLFSPSSWFFLSLKKLKRFCLFGFVGGL